VTRIPITMCHGLTEDDGKSEYPLTPDHFDRLVRIAHEMLFAL